ncbi:metallophosphoesterase family protein [bacterium]|nr:metallophosphoesterase family protein [bacterium]MCP5462974.1 metallophosphoesterase family protein [bacterium]
MRYAIISDIHGNLEALLAVLGDCGKKEIDRYICLGDIVGYGANPAECVKQIIDLDALCVVGNHDHAAIGLTDISFFNPYAKAAVEWTASKLSKKHKSFLSHLPFIITLEDITLVHSTLDGPERWRYILNDFDAEVNLKLFDNLICFIGHSHVPCMFQEQYNSKALFDFLNEMTIQQKTIINVGSVGQPRDGDPRASYVIYDSELRLVTFERIEYDIATAQKKIVKSGLPKILATRLQLGK